MNYPVPARYIGISTRYAYAPLRVGLSLMYLPTQKEVYFQPGDDESAIRKHLDALSECSETIIDRVADIALGVYF